MQIRKEMVQRTDHVATIVTLVPKTIKHGDRALVRDNFVVQTTACPQLPLFSIPHLFSGMDIYKCDGPVM